MAIKSTAAVTRNVDSVATMHYHFQKLAVAGKLMVLEVNV